MGKEVYADLYILVNTSMDLLCLMITATLLHRRIVRLRALLGALLGGGYALAVLLCGVNGLPGLLLDVAAACGICAITFAGKGVSAGRLLKNTAVYLLVSVLLGGIMTALYTWLNRLDLPLDFLEEDRLSVWMFALLATVATFMTLRGGRFFGLSAKTRSVTVEAVLFGKPVQLLAMVDSGNLLRDPVSGKSVIVADRSKLERVFPPALLREVGDPLRERWMSDYENAKKIRLIPTRTATGDALLTAVIPDSVTVTDGKEKIPSDYLIAAGRIGERASGFDALIPKE